MSLTTDDPPANVEPPHDPVPHSPPRTPRRRLPAAALATQRLCPYLVIEGGEWRSAVPAREHRCGAVVPPAPLAVEKQRRLCVSDNHLTCATYLAAAGVASDPDSIPEPAGVAVPAAALAGVTRWSIVRTTPVVLDGGRVPQVGSFVRSRTGRQVGLGLLLVAAFLAVAGVRLSPGSTPLVGADPGSDGSSSGSLVAGASRSPDATSTVLPSPTPAPSRTPPATRSPIPSASPVTARTYRVRRGDTLYGIAIRFKTTVKAVQQLNGLTSTNLRIGQILKIPDAIAR